MWQIAPRRSCWSSSPLHGQLSLQLLLESTRASHGPTVQGFSLKWPRTDSSLAGSFLSFAEMSFPEQQRTSVPFAQVSWTFEKIFYTFCRRTRVWLSRNHLASHHPRLHASGSITLHYLILISFNFDIKRIEWFNRMERTISKSCFFAKQQTLKEFSEIRN